MLKLKKINYSIDGNKILKDISLEFEKKKFYGILGPNGSGKSTLLDLIISHKKKDSGTVFLEEKDFELYKESERGKKISLLPQEFSSSFSYTGKEIINMGRYPYHTLFSEDEKSEEIVNKYVSLLEIHHLLEKEISEMSGGERQRILIAKTLVQDADYILLDEATSNLDIFHAYEAMKILKEEIITTEKTAIAVIHDLNLALAFCDEIILLKEGEVLKVGNIDDVLTAENIKEVFNIECEILDIREKKIIYVI
ncbi:MAG: ABC transporter ATP-binding protein [Fusobacteriaceae bacterium]